MPLRDHFRPPLRIDRPWDGVHSAWANTIAVALNRDLLPPDYFAMPQVTVGGRVEIDVATLKRPADSNGSVATALWEPPTLTSAVDFTHADAFEVQVVRDFGGHQLRAAIELVSPSNKDRPAQRRAFAVKCAAYLQRGASVVIVDVVTERLANLHDELMLLLKLDDLVWSAKSGLYAVAYRTTDVEMRLECWPEPLAVGEALPKLPLWLETDLVVPLDLEESYLTTCANLRIAD